jgi:hypothetical protein
MLGAKPIDMSPDTTANPSNKIHPPRMLFISALRPLPTNPVLGRNLRDIAWVASSAAWA